jgi:hypothetical protein
MLGISLGIAKRFFDELDILVTGVSEAAPQGLVAFFGVLRIFGVPGMRTRRPVLFVGSPFSSMLGIFVISWLELIDFLVSKVGEASLERTVESFGLSGLRMSRPVGVVASTTSMLMSPKVIPCNDLPLGPCGLHRLTTP